MVFGQTEKDTVIIKDSIPLKPALLLVDSGTLHPIKKKIIPHARKDSLAVFNAAARTDSQILKKTETTPVSPDAIQAPAGDNFQKTLRSNSFFSFSAKGFTATENIHVEKSYDRLFYLMMGILFYFAIVRALFGKYLANLMTLFFRVSMRQQQIREQVMQAPFPSLLLNTFFVISGGLYCSYLILYFNLPIRVGFWQLLLNCSLILVAIYLVKFIVLKCVGWVFNIQRATDTYIFIVFMTNKIMGVFLLPFLVMLSFSNALIAETAVTLSLIMLGFFFVRRFAISYGPIRKEIKLNGLHFFLYLCAFEIAPLLLIYKVLLSYLEKAY